METPTIEDVSVNVQEVVSYLRITGDFSPALGEVVERKLTAEAARQDGIEVTDEELQNAFDNFRYAMGLEDAEDTEEWMSSHGVSLDDLEQHIETNILVHKWKDRLEDQVDQSEYLQRGEVQSAIREMIYEDWLDEEL